ncbi:MAG: hypothetical protein DWQ31_00580 [Planctomycetota bacterium]|nr:MAG: hypothetical protein DWQ31_00580 [Planctomycetota bacterium]REJ86686.1 MAG: hypothetical protein DWQ35_22920 [Planctomycetota bacterium]
MAAKKKTKRKDASAPPPVRRAANDVRVTRAGDDAWELLHPRCAVERADDLEEVDSMLELGETDVAREELRWLLSGCPNLIAAHQRLGEIALEEGDLKLARGHFGQAYRAGLKALRDAGMPSPLPQSRAANESFFAAGKGLAHCLLQLDKQQMAREVVDVLLRCDPSDPLALRQQIAAK